MLIPSSERNFSSLIELLKPEQMASNPSLLVPCAN
jgi:hypothetical protein